MILLIFDWLLFIYLSLISNRDYIVPFLTISSILIDIVFTNFIFIGAMFNSYNYWYLLSYSNQLTIHYSILFLIISIFIIILFVTSGSLFYRLSLTIFTYLISYSFFSNFTFFIPIYLDFILIFSIFFFKGPINSIEVFTGFNICYSILFINFFSLFFQIQLIILFLLFSLSSPFLLIII